MKSYAWCVFPCSTAYHHPLTHVTILQLAEALIEHETLDLEEVKKVIRGEKIREGEKHAVSNVEITTITSPPLPIPVPDAGTPPVISSPPSSRQSEQTEIEDPPFISA